MYIRIAGERDVDKLLALFEKPRRPLPQSALIGDVHALIAEDGELPVGRALVKTCNQGALVEGVFVTRSQRSRGVGTALMQAAHSVATHRGHGKVVLQVRRDNYTAMNLYGRLGYSVSGQVWIPEHTWDKTKWQTRLVPGWEMQKRLDPVSSEPGLVRSVASPCALAL